MKKIYSQEEMEQIMKKDIDIPESVDQRIHETYEKLGLTGTAGPVKRRSRRKTWTTMAAAAALIAALGATAVAATKFFTAQLKEDDGKLTYSVNVEPDQKEAHEIRVTPTYEPEGYVYHDDGPYMLKWHNDETGGGMSIIPYNAAELYEMSRTQENPLHNGFDEDNYIETVTIQGMKVDIFCDDDANYIDSGDTRQDVFLFNEEWGYAVHVVLHGPDLPEQEALKVAKGLDIEVLDTTVPYASEEEIEQTNKESRQITEMINASGNISGDAIRGIGDEMTISDEGHIVYEGIKYQTLDIKVADTLPLADYPKEKYLEDYDSTLANYLNEDGTLKPHKRFISEGSRETEDAEASFVIVTTRLSNTGNETKDVYLSPFLRYLDANDDGSYTLSREKSWPAEESWASFTTEGFPFWQSVPGNEGKQILFTTIDPGDTVECTSVYVVDNDLLDTAYMQYFNVGAAMPDTPELYVKVTE